MANEFVAKAVLGLTTRSALIGRLVSDRVLQRICGFSLCKKLPSEATFSRAFEEFADMRLAERIHETLVKDHLGGTDRAPEPRRHCDFRTRMSGQPGDTQQARDSASGAPISSEALAPTTLPAKRKQADHSLAKRRPPPRSRPLPANGSKPWTRYPRRSPVRVMAAQSAMPKDIKPGGFWNWLPRLTPAATLSTTAGESPAGNRNQDGAPADTRNLSSPDGKATIRIDLPWDGNLPAHWRPSRAVGCMSELADFRSAM